MTRSLFLTVFLITACYGSTPVGVGDREEDVGVRREHDPERDASTLIIDAFDGSDSPDVTTPEIEGRCEEHGPGESSVVVTSDCDELSSHDEPFAGGTALRVIGIYETDAPHHEMGDCTIHLDLDHAVTLLLTSYESTRWIIENEGPGPIERIIVNGYDPQEVIAPSGVPVDITGYSDGGNFWGSAFDWNDHEARELVEIGESMTGLALTSFHGCYHAREFTMTEGCDGPIAPSDLDCDDEGEPHVEPDLSVVGEACNGVMGESHFCLTMTMAGEVAVLGLESGDVCAFASLGLEELSRVDSIAWYGQYLYSCAGPRQRLARFDMVTGAVETADVWCEAVAAYDGGLLVEPSWEEGEFFGQMWFYPTFRDAQCGDVEVLSVDFNNSRITVFDDVLYSAWHSTDTVETLSLPSGTMLGSIELEGYDTWVNGMSVIDGELLVLSASWPEGRVVVFDVNDGTALWEVPVSEPLRGLYCLSNE